jgi:NAD(P)-dependent dehydrogenase (short-subunit alcohol dehydrogenase family)
MRSIVITGSTRGIGYGLAHEFLKRGCRVTVNGRSPQSTTTAITSLTQSHDATMIAGQAGDVSNPEDHQKLWQTAVSKFGKVDIWINNAGIGHPLKMVWELSPEQVNQVVDVDLKGLIFGSQVAIRGMLAQGFGHLYNMEGFGSNGRSRPGISIYGTTKAGVRFLTESLTKETENTPVKVSAVSPGIVITEFITDQYQNDPEGLKEGKKVFNILGDKVETVTPWLVDKMLTNDKSGELFEWLTPFKAAKRFATARFNKRDLFDD